LANAEGQQLAQKDQNGSSECSKGSSCGGFVRLVFTIVTSAAFALTAFVPFAPLAMGADPASEFPRTVRDSGVAATAKVVNAADGVDGSGVVIQKSGQHAYLLTACHVVPKARTVEVLVAGSGTGNESKPGKSTKLKAEVLARSPEADLAVLRLPSEGAPSALPVAPAGTKPKLAVSVGWEKGESPTALDESLKDKVRLKRPGEMGTVWCWETVRKQAAGRSGGPLVDEMGRVVGLASGHDGEAGYYVHADEIRAFLRSNGLKWVLEEDR
jgi:S1-C subfamily serine protease